MDISRKFISFEGGEGSGKSTQIKLFASRLQSFLKDRSSKNDCPSIIQTREPGGCPAAETIRKLLVASDGFDIDPITQTLLLYAGRKEHLREVIIPALQRGDWVLSDRFSDSTWAYQGYAMGVDKKFLQLLEDEIVSTCGPDLTFFLDIQPQTGLERSFSQESGEHKYESMGLALHEKIYKGFQKLIHKNPERFIVINASRTIEEIEVEIWEAFTQYFLKGS